MKRRHYFNHVIEADSPELIAPFLPPARITPLIVWLSIRSRVISVCRSIAFRCWFGGYFNGLSIFRWRRSVRKPFSVCPLSWFSLGSYSPVLVGYFICKCNFIRKMRVEIINEYLNMPYCRSVLSRLANRRHSRVQSWASGSIFINFVQKEACVLLLNDSTTWLWSNRETHLKSHVSGLKIEYPCCW